MGASFGRVAFACLFALALSLACGDTMDDLSKPADAASGSDAVAGSSGDAGQGSGGASAAGGSGGDGGVSAAGGSTGTDGSAGNAGTSGAAGTSPADGAAGTRDFDAAAGNGGTGAVDADSCTPCPKAAPTSGSSCSPCPQPTICTYNSCAEITGSVATATCSEDSKTWTLKSDPCNAFQCGAPPGGRRCNANQICVRPFNTCVDNPCLDQPFACGCAQTACPGVDYRCEIQSEPRTINCNCLTC